MNMPVVKPAGVAALALNATVSMDDVVSAFVSKYETQLFDRKKLLSAEVTRTQNEMKEFTESIAAQIDTSKHNTKSLPLGLVAEAKPDTLSIDFARERASFTVVVRRSKEPTPDPYTYRTSATQLEITVFEDLPAEAAATHKQLEILLEAQQADLAEVLDKIKSVARKEREVRGRIAMRKIEESGYADLLEDTELAQLVTL